MDLRDIIRPEDLQAELRVLIVAATLATAADGFRLNDQPIFHFPPAIYRYLRETIYHFAVSGPPEGNSLTMPANTALHVLHVNVALSVEMQDS